jgi:spore coat protein CotH
MRSRSVLLALVLVVAAGCGGGETTADDQPDADPGPDPSDVMFEPTRIVEVAIEMPEAAWDEIRMQNRDSNILMGADCQAEEFPNPFTHREATVTIDGTRLERVGVRKKGFLGSLDNDKPSLKIKFDEYVADQEHAGLSGLTLNNNKQDPAYLRQCLAYQLFAQGGVPAPRCNFAHVTINGRDLGLFTHVEAVKKRFLARHFADNDGRLYEGTLSDFRPGWMATFEAKTNESDPDRSDLDAMATAAAAPDASFVTEVDARTSIDRFLTFWAMETLVEHGDGYANNTNNFFVYRDPTTGLFEFMPWGTDSVMGSRGSPPGSIVLANGILARRLYLLPETRDRFITRARELVASVWTESTILAEIDRIETLIAPIVATDPFGDAAGFADAVDDVRAFVSRRKADVTAMLDAPPVWDRPLRDSFCFVDLGPIQGTFDTTYKTAEPPDIFAAGTGTLTGSISGTPITFTQLGTNAKPGDGGKVEVQFFARTSATEIFVVVINLRPDQLTPGPAVPIEIFTSYALRFDLTTGAAEVVGTLLGGTITLSQADDTEGAPVVGIFTSQIYNVPF